MSASRGIEQFKKNGSRFFGAAEADLGRRQLGTYGFICPGAANGPSPPPALPNQRSPLFLKCLVEVFPEHEADGEDAEAALADFGDGFGGAGDGGGDDEQGGDEGGGADEEDGEG